MNNEGQTTAKSQVAPPTLLAEHSISAVEIAQVRLEQTARFLDAPEVAAFHVTLADRGLLAYDIRVIPKELARLTGPARASQDERD